MKKIIPYLLVPTGLWMFWLVAYIDNIADSSYQDWWDMPFFLTLLFVESGAIAISIQAILAVMKRYDKTKESE